MFKLDPHHRIRKFIAVSASALLLLSVGGGALGATHSNVHAASLYGLFQKLDRSSQDQLVDAFGDGQINMAEIHRGKREYQAHPAAFDALAKKYNHHVSPQLLEYYINNPAAAQQLLNNAERGKSTRKPSKRAVKSVAKRSAKKSHRRVSKRVVKNLKKHLRKGRRTNRKRKPRATKANLLKQVKSLRRQLRRIKNQMTKLSHCKYRTLRAKRYVKRQLTFLNREYKSTNAQLKQMSKRVDGMNKKTKRPNRKRRNVRRTRKTSKRMNKRTRRHAKCIDKKRARRTVKRSLHKNVRK